MEKKYVKSAEVNYTTRMQGKFNYEFLHYEFFRLARNREINYMRTRPDNTKY